MSIFAQTVSYSLRDHIMHVAKIVIPLLSRSCHDDMFSPLSMHACSWRGEEIAEPSVYSHIVPSFFFDGASQAILN
jgi:hypothetical protein